MILNTIDTPAVISINKAVCLEGGNPFHCFDEGKVDSALHSSFYPGSYPFHHGGIPKIAGALAFYICQAHAFEDGNKRTAALVAIVFLNANGLGINYPQHDSHDGLSDLIIGIASSTVDIEESKKWFDSQIIFLK